MANTHRVSLQLNGRAVDVQVEPRELLIHTLRERLAHTGPHIGCETSHCGACTVDLDGRSVKACTVLTVQCEGSELLTVEGLEQGGALHALQEGFTQEHGLQCGYCTPGMIMAAIDIVNRKGSAVSEAVIREELDGNICRCTGYHNIVAAVRAGAAAMSGASRRQAAE